MSEPASQNSALGWPRWAWSALALAGITFALVQNASTSLNSDLGWILDFGRETVERRALPTVNGRSFVEPNHPLVMHEWLACVAFFLLHDAWGAAGLIALKVSAISLLMLGIAASLRAVSRHAISALFAILLAAWTIAPAVALLRPQLFAWGLLAFVVYAGLSSKRWTLWACLPVVIFWGNVHGSVLAGVVILAVLCCARLLERRWGESSPMRTWELVLVPALCVVALLLNPYGLSLIVHTWHHATDTVRLLNAEWVSLLRAGPWLPFERTAVILFSVITLLALVALPFRRVRLWALLVIAVASSLSAQRHLRMAPILLAPAVAVILDNLMERARLTLDRWVPLAAGGLAAVLGLTWFGGWGDVFTLRDRINMNIGNALWVMRANGLQGRVWNDFNWGGALLWALPESQVATDGRNVTAYSAELLRQSILLEDEKDPLGVLTRSGAELVLLPPNHLALKKLQPTYQPIFCDDVSCLLTSKPEFVVRAHAGLRLPPQPVPASMFFALPGRPFLELNWRAPDAEPSAASGPH